MCTIIQEPHTTLRSRATEVDPSTITTPEIQRHLAQMREALEGEPDGVALAAPQIDLSLRIFIVAGFVFDLKKKNISGTRTATKVFINPEIIKSSKEMKWMSGEGCLSVRWKYGTTKRHKLVTVRAYDETGKLFTLSGSGLLAQIFQHEIDHLDGILFIDHAKDVRNLSTEEIQDYEKELELLRRERSR